MIKAKGYIQRDGKEKRVILLGLSEGNCIRLRQGRPMLIKGEEMEIPYDILIVWGLTEEAIVKEVIEEWEHGEEFATDLQEMKDDPRDL